MAAVNLLLVGRTGNGKSSTGNSILRRKVFISRSSSSTVTDDISEGSAQIDGKTITVGDGPGLGDTGFDDSRGVESAIAKAKKALSFFLNGFHALLIVLKYGVRFTKQEKDAVQMIKSVYGEDVVRSHAIIIMTHGESFDMDNEDEEGKTFEDWFKEQTGDVEALFKECNQRVVLFRNKTNDNRKLKEQFDKLMAKVDEIRATCNPYTMEDFRKAESGRAKLTIVSRLPKLEKETDEVLSRINQEVQQLEGQPHLTHTERLQRLQKLQGRLEQHKADLQSEDHDTGSLSQLILQVSVTEMSIKTKVELCKRMVDEEYYQREARRNLGEHRVQMGFSEESHPLADNGRKGENIMERKTLYIMVFMFAAALLFLFYLLF